MLHIFIINPFAGDKTFADDLRTKLSSIEGLDYFVFNTRYAGYETELVRKILHIFNGEKLRFYCCGGSGTMRNMLNGFDDFSKVEIAFFPCGLTNDFLKMFGESAQRFEQIEELIYGDVIDIDYIKSNYGVSLNTLSTGLDSNCLKKMDDFRLFRVISKDLPYSIATVYSIFVSKTEEYELTLNGETRTGKFAEIFVGNGSIFGGSLYFAERTCINDGKAIYSIVGNKRGFGLLKVMLALTGKKYDKYPELMDLGEVDRIRFRRADGQPFSINQDGDIINDVTECEAEIVHKGMRFVVPKGVKAL